jgi:hypothetical protein
LVNLPTIVRILVETVRIRRLLLTFKEVSFLGPAVTKTMRTTVNAALVVLNLTLGMLGWKMVLGGIVFRMATPWIYPLCLARPLVHLLMAPLPLPPHPFS